MASTFGVTETRLSAQTNAGTSNSARLAGLGFVFLIACWMFFFGLGNFPLFNPDEALYAEPAQEMLYTGNYLTTTLNYVVRFTKPPLCIWAMALSYQVFGGNEFAARFFGAACGAILVACVYLFLSRVVSNKAAILGALTLLTAPLFLATGREAITDMPLSLFIAGSLFAFYCGFHEKRPAWNWIAYVLIGLAVMTKGPVALILPAVTLLPYHLWRGNLLPALKFYRLQWGLLIIAAISLPWFVAEIAATKGAYFSEFIMRENFQRFTTVVDSHRGGWYYHLAAMFGGYFPWAVFIPQSLSRLLVKAQTTKNPLLGWLAACREFTETQDLLLFAACFATVTLLFFSASVSKLLPYTLPAFPALAVLLGLEIDYILEGRRFGRLVFPLALLAIVYGAVGVFGSLAIEKIRHLPANLFGIGNGYLSFEGLVILVALGFALAKKPLASMAAFSVLTLAATGFFGYKVLAVISQDWEGPIPGLARFAAASGQPIFVYKTRKPSVPFYAHRATALSPNQENLKSQVEDELPKLPNAYVIARVEDQQKIMPQGLKLVVRDGKYVLLHWSRP